jgi:hypothetical protein
VRSATGEGVPYAVVALQPAFPERFADDSGAFTFREVVPGRYHLHVRQVGFKPLDTAVVVLPNSDLALALTLEHLVVELAEITVTAEVSRAGRAPRCTLPGSPDSTQSPELAAIFGQLKQNAERYWMLADSYPVLYRMGRRIGYVDQAGKVRVTSVDTLDLRTDTRWHYAPGRLVNEVKGPRGDDEVQVNLPTLPDFADSAFVAAHCYRLIGLDTLEGQSYVRIDFRAAERLREPDADGSAYLDPSTYLIRHAMIRLTHPERALVGLATFDARVRYREIAPSIVIVEHVTAAQAAYQGQRLFERREEQDLLNVAVLRRLPTAARPGP